ncbi:MAG: hypothetical protein HY551_02980, partial [Elusimicrobia bacterium]|nr:hypothetical protein [Elusimicrobiota bacterium]
MKLFTRVFLILLLTALVPALGTSLWLIRSNTAVRENARLLHQQVTLLFADIVESAAGEMNRVLGFVEDLERAGAGNSQLEFRVLQRAVASHPALALVSLFDASGHETNRMADPQLFAQDFQVESVAQPLLAQARATGRVSLGVVELREAVPVLPLVYPLSDGRVVYAQYSFKTLWRRVRNQQVGPSGHLLLLDASGRPLPNLAADFPGNDWPGFPPASEEASGWADRIATPRGTCVGAYAPAPSLGWRVLSLQPRAEALALSDRLLGEVAIFLLVLATVVALATFWVTGRLTKPLRALIEGARRASRNEFDRT